MSIQLFLTQTICGIEAHTSADLVYKIKYLNDMGLLCIMRRTDKSFNLSTNQPEMIDSFN
jgi:hypothetical protein